METQNSFRSLLKRFRMDKGWSLEKLSEKTGVSTKALWSIEHGKSQPFELTIFRIRRTLPEFAEILDAAELDEVA